MAPWSHHGGEGESMTVEPQADGELSSQPYGHAAESTPAGEVTIVPVSRTIAMYSISENELDQIGRASGALAVHLIFFGIAFGAASAFLLSLLAQELSNKTIAFIWGLFALTLATVYFGIQAVRNFHDTSRSVRTVKKESMRSPAG
jgi:hypothetical protein